MCLGVCSRGLVLGWPCCEPTRGVPQDGPAHGWPVGCLRSFFRDCNSCHIRTACVVLWTSSAPGVEKSYTCTARKRRGMAGLVREAGKGKLTCNQKRPRRGVAEVSITARLVCIRTRVLLVRRFDFLCGARHSSRATHLRYAQVCWKRSKAFAVHRFAAKAASWVNFLLGTRLRNLGPKALSPSLLGEQRRNKNSFADRLSDSSADDSLESQDARVYWVESV